MTLLALAQDVSKNVEILLADPGWVASKCAAEDVLQSAAAHAASIAVTTPSTLAAQESFDSDRLPSEDALTFSLGDSTGSGLD